MRIAGWSRDEPVTTAAAHVEEHPASHGGPALSDPSGRFLWTISPALS